MASRLTENSEEQGKDCIQTKTSHFQTHKTLSKSVNKLLTYLQDSKHKKTLQKSATSKQVLNLKAKINTKYPLTPQVNSYFRSYTKKNLKEQKSMIEHKQSKVSLIKKSLSKYVNITKSKSIPSKLSVKENKSLCKIDYKKKMNIGSDALRSKIEGKLDEVLNKHKPINKFSTFCILFFHVIR